LRCIGNSTNTVAWTADPVHAQSARLVQDFGMDDTTSMLFRFASGATGYLGTVIATAETWRMQVFGSRGWAEWVTSSICRPGR